MASHYKSEGIILQEREAGEQDRAFQVFTKEYGKLPLRAISERKITSKLRGGLQLFSYSQVEFIQGRNRIIVTDALPLEVPHTLRQNEIKLRLALKIADTGNLLIPEHTKDLRIWSLLLRIFHVLDNQGDTLLAASIYQYFFWNLLSYIGYKPHLDSCVECGFQGTQLIYFFIPRGGLLCTRCAAREQDGRNTMLIKISQEMIQELKRLLEDTSVRGLSLSDKEQILLNYISRAYRTYMRQTSII